MRLVVAIGGNALIQAGDDGSWDRQLENAHAIAADVVALRAAGHEIVLTHGNGPQVGLLMLQQEGGETPALPLDALIAMTQGQTGYLLATAIADVDPDVSTVALLTRVVVDPDDPAFVTPTKPVGPFYEAGEAVRLASERRWHVAEDAGRGWRRVVPSPRPLRVVGAEHTSALLATGAVVIAVGGGGIPIAADGRAVQGVIDKDRASAELALAIDADLLVLLTGVPRVSVDFGTRWERELSRITVSEALRGLADGEFPAGSMGPKIESAQRFVEGGRGRAVITTAGRLAAAVDGEDGTWVVADRDAAVSA
ncbi:MAG TPA: carbamate kinase [Solirubrobacteraceae bacterium]|nr:carbamate kinase [Solirubrobacteraceae bacterium]